MRACDGVWMWDLGHEKQIVYTISDDDRGNGSFWVFKVLLSVVINQMDMHNDLYKVVQNHFNRLIQLRYTYEYPPLAN